MSHYSSLAEALYFSFCAIGVLLFLIVVYILLFKNIFKTYALYAKEGIGLKPVLKTFSERPKFGKRQSKNSKKNSNMPLVCCIMDVSDNQLTDNILSNKCCINHSYHINATHKKRFKMVYETWLWQYCKHSINIESSTLARLRSVLTHQFPFIKLVSTLIYTVISITMWESKEVFVVLIFYEIMYVLFILMLMPYRSKTAFYVDLFMSSAFIATFSLFRIYLAYHYFELLETATLLPAIATIVAMVGIPLFTTFVHAGGSHVYVPVYEDPLS